MPCHIQTQYTNTKNPTKRTPSLNKHTDYDNYTNGAHHTRHRRYTSHTQQYNGHTNNQHSTNLFYLVYANVDALTTTLLLSALLITMAMTTGITQCAHTNSSKILIVTPTSNHPEYIALQNMSFKKYLQDPYEFMVFNDATDEETIQEIDNICASLNIQCIRVPQENRQVGTVVSWASYRHGQAINYIMKSIGTAYKGIVMLIDSDMFLIKEFSCVDFLEGYDIAGLSRGPNSNKVAYMWPGLLFFRMNALPNKKTMNFMPEDTFRFDTGGSLYHYLEANPSIKKLLFPQGRLKLDKNLMPYLLYSSPCRGSYVKCSSCTNKIYKKQRPPLSKCVHKKSIYRQLHFRDSIIDLILSGKVPFACEFILGDTFFHISGSSGYYKWSETDNHKRNVGMHNFMSFILEK